MAPSKQQPHGTATPSSSLPPPTSPSAGLTVCSSMAPHKQQPHATATPSPSLPPPTSPSAGRQPHTTATLSSSLPPPTSPSARLRAILASAQQERRCELLPAAHDAISAALIQRAGFSVCFMSGFGVSASLLAMPDAGLISFSEQLEVGRNICNAARGVCVIGDGDTGFGGSSNLRRTIEGYARAGFAAITIEDQVYPKRCSYARGLAVLQRPAALARLRAAIAARDALREESGLDMLIVGRTDCRNAEHGGGLYEAIARCRAFEAAGADIVYAEGLRDIKEMVRLNASVSLPTMLAQVEGGPAPMLTPEEGAQLGYTLILHGLTLLNVSLTAMKGALAGMAAGTHPDSGRLMRLAELHKEVGFEELYEWEAKCEGSHEHEGATREDGNRTTQTDANGPSREAAKRPTREDDNGPTREREDANGPARADANGPTRADAASSLDEGNCTTSAAAAAAAGGAEGPSKSSSDQEGSASAERKRRSVRASARNTQQRV